MGHSVGGEGGGYLGTEITFASDVIDGSDRGDGVRKPSEGVLLCGGDGGEGLWLRVGDFVLLVRFAHVGGLRRCYGGCLVEAEGVCVGEAGECDVLVVEPQDCWGNDGRIEGCLRCCGWECCCGWEGYVVVVEGDIDTVEELGSVGGVACVEDL